MKKGEVLHIAFADDHVAGRMSIALYLEKMGAISVDIQADNGKHLIAQLEEAVTLPSVCILDVNMPKMNGLETLKTVKAKWPDMKFLVMSAFPSEHLVIPMIRHGAGGYLLKTCYPTEIVQALVSIHQTGYYHSEFLSQKLLMDHVNLTEDEINVLRESCSDLTYAQIGDKLHKSRKSIDGYRDSLFRKLGVKSRSGLVLYALQSGIAPMELFSESQF